MAFECVGLQSSMLIDSMILMIEVVCALEYS